MGLYITVGAEFPVPGKPAPGFDAQRLPPAPKPHHSHSASHGASLLSCFLVFLLKSHLELCDTPRSLLASLLNQTSALPSEHRQRQTLSWDHQCGDQNTNRFGGEFVLQLHLHHLLMALFVVELPFPWPSVAGKCVDAFWSSCRGHHILISMALLWRRVWHWGCRNWEMKQQSRCFTQSSGHLVSAPSWPFLCSGTGCIPA